MFVTNLPDRHFKMIEISRLCAHVCPGSTWRTQAAFSLVMVIFMNDAIARRLSSTAHGTPQKSSSAILPSRACCPPAAKQGVIHVCRHDFGRGMSTCRAAMVASSGATSGCLCSRLSRPAHSQSTLVTTFHSRRQLLMRPGCHATRCAHVPDATALRPMSDSIRPLQHRLWSKAPVRLRVSDSEESIGWMYASAHDSQCCWGRSSGCALLATHITSSSMTCSALIRHYFVLYFTRQRGLHNVLLQAACLGSATHCP